MKKLLTVMTLLSVVGVLGQGAGAAGRTPVYDVTCALNGMTTASWSHVSLDQVTFEWLDASGNSFQPDPTPVSPHPPHGSVSTAAWVGSGITPVGVTVSFDHADGSGADPVSVSCT